jgi:C1A family cysteine protease
MRKYGYIPDLPDQRDFRFAGRVKALPSKLSLINGFEAPYDQGQLGSCTANAIAGALQYARKAQKETDSMLSRLFVYYNERAMEGTVKSDSGAQIRDGIKSVAKQGACLEANWPYVISKFASKPSTACYSQALKFEALVYESVAQSRLALQTALAAGFPVVLGFTVYESFESAAVAKSGNAPMPKKNESVLGGHAVCLVGYDNSKGLWLLRNSWGTSWGQAGYFTLPYAYLVNPNLASDFWAITKVE